MQYLKIIFIVYTIICIIDAFLLYKKYVRVQNNRDEWDQLLKRIRRSQVLLIIFIIIAFIFIVFDL